MQTTTSLITKQQSIPHSAEIQKGVEFHEKTAGYLMAAAAHHFKASSQLNDGNYEHAAKSAKMAKDYFNLAENSIREKTKNPFFE